MNVDSTYQFYHILSNYNSQSTQNALPLLQEKLRKPPGLASPVLRLWNGGILHSVELTFRDFPNMPEWFRARSRILLNLYACVPRFQSAFGLFDMGFGIVNGS
jgi:hypothetical protein